MEDRIREFIEDSVKEYTTHDEDGIEVIYLTDVIEMIKSLQNCNNCNNAVYDNEYHDDISCVYKDKCSIVASTDISYWEFSKD